MKDFLAGIKEKLPGKGKKSVLELFRDGSEEDKAEVIAWLGTLDKAMAEFIHVSVEEQRMINLVETLMAWLRQVNLSDNLELKAQLSRIWADWNSAIDDKFYFFAIVNLIEKHQEKLRCIMKCLIDAEKGASDDNFNR